MASVTELSLTPAPTSGCGCGHAHETDWPRLDARQVPHAIRHGAILGALGQVQPGAAMVLIAPHDPLPLLRQMGEMFDDVTVSYLVRGPEAWELLLSRG